MFKRRAGSRAEREARKVFKPAQAETTEYAKAEKAFQENRERLKAERLAREVATADDNLKRKPAS
jgi:transcription elongation GreA/GreB family factor